MSPATTANKIASIIEDELNLNPGSVGAGDSLGYDLHADSLDYAMIMIRIEEEFGIYFPKEVYEDITHKTSVWDLIEATENVLKDNRKYE